MHDVVTLAARGLAGGTLVVVFALIGESVSPKAFSGLFSSAPSVALASLGVTIVVDSVADARQASVGMVVGSVGMTVCCIVAAVAIPRLRTVLGSVAAWLSWLAVSFGLYWAVFIGAH